MIGKTIAIAAFCCAASSVVVGIGASGGQRNSKNGPMLDSETILGIALGQSRLADVQQKLGPATIWSSGDASTAEHKVCYVTQGPNQVVLVFASNGEMAGPPENQLTDIKVVRDAAYRNRSKCGNLTISGDEASTNRGLKLGLTQESVRKILGPPSVGGFKWRYFLSVDRPLPTSDKNYQYWLVRKDECFDGKSPFFSINSAITIQFEGENVIGLSLSRTETIC